MNSARLDLERAVRAFNPLKAFEVLERDPSLVDYARELVDRLEHQIEEEGRGSIDPAFGLVWIEFSQMLSFRRQLPAWEARRYALSVLDELGVSTFKHSSP